MPLPKAKKVAMVSHELGTMTMSKEQLEAFARSVKEENDKEREERKFFQMTPDELRLFSEITRNELEEVRAKIRNKEREIEEEAEKNYKELRRYSSMPKVKHLQCYHHNNLTKSKTEAFVALNNAVHDEIERERNVNKRNGPQKSNKSA